MRILGCLLFLAIAGLWWRVRRLERRLEQFQDKAVDWRLHLGRRQEELTDDIAALRGGRPPGLQDPPAAGSASAAGAGLIQIRPLGGSRR